MRYVASHRKPTRLDHCWTFHRNFGTKLNEYRVKRAIAQLRRQNLLSQTSLRPMQKAIQARLMKQTGSSNAAD